MSESSPYEQLDNEGSLQPLLPRHRGHSRPRRRVLRPATWRRLQGTLTGGLRAMRPNEKGRIASERPKERVSCRQPSTVGFAAVPLVRLHGATRESGWVCRQSSSGSRLHREAGPPVRRGSRNRGQFVREECTARPHGVPRSRVLNGWSQVQSWRILARF